MSTRDDVLREDLEANGFTVWTWRDQLSPTSRCRIMRFMRRLRRLEQLGGGHGLLVRLKTSVLWRVHARDAAILGFTIPPGTCGPGLSIAHYGTVVINGGARIGANCRIHPGVVIGKSGDGAPTIGDRCYIGAGAKVYGPVSVGHESVIAPNAVVNRDVEANSIVGGVPARVLRADVAYSWRD